MWPTLNDVLGENFYDVWFQFGLLLESLSVIGSLYSMYYNAKLCAKISLEFLEKYNLNKNRFLENLSNLNEILGKSNTKFSNIFNDFM